MANSRTFDRFIVRHLSFFSFFGCRSWQSFALDEFLFFVVADQKALLDERRI